MENTNDKGPSYGKYYRFGQLAVMNGFVTIEQLKKALSEQISNDPLHRLRPHRLLGEIFFERGWMDSKEIVEFPRFNRHNLS